MTGRPARFVDVDGCFNFRDLGGYRALDGRTIAWRKLFRSDSLHRGTAAGLAALASLRVATVLDLRTLGELAEHPWSPPTGWSGRWQHLPLRAVTPDWSVDEATKLSSEDFVAAHYYETVLRGGPVLAAAVTALSMPKAMPAVFYCAAGKDRTGIVAALLLVLLGVSAADAARDYALSDVGTARWEASLRAGNRDDTQTAWSHVPSAMLRADQDNMLTFLRRINAEYGSVANLVANLGVSDNTIDRLRATLLT